MADKYSLDGEDYTAADVKKLNDEEFDHLLSRARALNEPEDDIQWLIDSHSTAEEKKAAAKADEG